MSDRPYVDFPCAEPDARTPTLSKRQGVSRTLAPETVLLDTLACVTAISAAFKITEAQLRSDDRRRHCTEPRGVLYWLLLRHTLLSLNEIARVAGKIDHTTVLHGIKRTEERRARDTWFRDFTDRLERELEEKAKAA